MPEREFGEPWNGVGVGARALGMGGAFTAVADDLSGIYWNPAGLVRLRDTQIGWMTGSPYTKRDKSDLWADSGAFGFATTAYKPWATGLMAIRSFHPESLVPWQEDYFIGTFAMPLNTSKTASFGVNLKYMKSDRFYDRPFDSNRYIFDFEAVSGWSMDMGAMYMVPIAGRDRMRQLNFGLMGRNMLGRWRVRDTERSCPSQVSLGTALIFDDLIPRERSIMSINYDTALRAEMGGTSSQIRLGYEQWFLQHFGAFRFGYAAPVPSHAMQEVAYGYFAQGQPVWTGGVTIIFMNTQIDLGVTMPTEQRQSDSPPEVPEIQMVDISIPSLGVMPIAPRQIYLQVTYHWALPKTLPMVNVKVEPMVFSPKNGEIAIFSIDYRDEYGIGSWTLEIRNAARVPVRTFSASGPPPSRLAWDGLDDRFNLVPDGDHTYTIRVSNIEGSEASTQPQPLRIFTPGHAGTRGDPTLIYKVLEETARREAERKAEVKPEIEAQIRASKAIAAGPGNEGGPVTGGYAAPVSPVPRAVTGEGSESATLSKESENMGGLVSYRGISPDQILRVQVPPEPGAESAMVTEYRTQRYILKYLLKEVRQLTEQNFATAGDTVGTYMVQARYGVHLLVVESPMETVRALRQGRVDDARWLRASTVILDGREIRPEL